MIICHMTSAHLQEDVRIFHKECVSLANAGYDIYHISCGETYDKDGVHLIGFGKPQTGRAGRMTKTARNVYKAAAELDADVYHFHDPELLPYGLKLKRRGKKVIFDSHEDVSAQIADKRWIPKPFRKIVSCFYKFYETHVVKHLDAVVAATPHIADTFKNRCKIITVVNNYPKLDDIIFHETPFKDRKPIICYAGGINEIRGEKIMVEAMEAVNGELIIAGDHEIENVGKVKYIGSIDRKSVNELYGKARAGIVIYQPAKNHIDSQPIKLFEFMAAGLPVVASDFPLWKEIVEKNNGGICVDPTSADAVGRACEELISHPEDSQKMGQNGRKAVLEKYSWNSEEKKLLSLYKTIIGLNNNH